MTQEMDRIRLDSLRIKTRGGKMTTPYKGQSVWVEPYGRSAGDMELIRQSWSALGRGSEDADKTIFKELSEFMAEECHKTDAVNIRTGEPHAQPDTWEDVAEWSNELWTFMVKRLMGAEDQGEGSAASESSTDTSETEAAKPPSP